MCAPIALRDLCNGSEVPMVQSDNRYSSDPQEWDLIIVGAGVAGCALAHTQGKDGRRVLIVERNLSQPDRIVGELLQPGGYLKLEELGLENCVTGIDSQKVFGYCMFKNGQEAVVRYSSNEFSSNRFPCEWAGRSFHHGRFVQRLRQAAAAHESVTVRQGVAKALMNEEGRALEDGQQVKGIIYKTADGVERKAWAALTIVCDGMHSSLRTKLSTPQIRSPSIFVGVRLTGCTLPYPNFGHVVLAHPSPILFYPISSTEVRCLVDIPGSQPPKDLKAYLANTVAPQLPRQLEGAFLRGLDSGATRCMTNKLMPAAPRHQPGALLLGDAFNMRHPLTGGGMTVALGDVALLSELLHSLPDFRDPEKTRKATYAFYRRRKHLSGTINTLANALYQVFCDRGTPTHESLRQACFDYLKRGGSCSDGPIAMLGGLAPNPWMLIYHFFCVAWFGVTRLVMEQLRFPQRWAKEAPCLLAWAFMIIFPILWTEGIFSLLLDCFTCPPPAPVMRRNPRLHQIAVSQDPVIPRNQRPRAQPAALVTVD
uniref:Squalene monooxygenase n=1 Tax=Botryococcus braunii TaxID=38881 RepID=A0A0E4B8N8_BOTBR|nr:squalene 2,3-epoxidase [Botryococcus braunii]